MATTVGGDESLTTLAWSGGVVDVPGIETALARLRHDAAGVESKGDGPFATRTSVLNLVSYTADAEVA